jgi:microcystin degradation protein MlrC
MQRILVAECKQEVSSFNPALSHKEDFQCAYGADVLRLRRGEQSELAGALGVFAARPDVQVVPAFRARAITSGGVLAAPDWHWLQEEFGATLAAAGAVDAAYFALHGAMATQDEADPEGALLETARRVLGERLPIVISLDLHGILTARMLAQIDAHTVFHTYPHEDMLDTGERAARLLLRILDEGLRPATALVPIPALVRGSELITSTGIFGRFMRECETIERSPGGLAAGMFIGNPFTDVPDLRSNSAVITTDPERAAREAKRLAEEFWRVRQVLHEDLLPLAGAVQAARETTTGAVVLMDAADATSSGASGDSNAVLRACLDAGYTGRALLPIIDPRAAAACFAAGVGHTVRTPVGGYFDPVRFPPLTLEGRVHLLAEGRFIAEYSGAETVSGPTAVLQAQNYTVVLGSRAVSLHDRSFYLAHGQDPRQFDLVVVKSPHCKPHMYQEWCTRLINVDAPGAASANLSSLGHTACRRPIFPLDADVTFTPHVQVFQR